MQRTFTAKSTAGCLLAALTAAAAPAMGIETPPARALGPSTEWRFTAALDGKPIGEHRFSLEGGGAGPRRLVSDAEFRVTLLGVPIYRYRHLAEERWEGDCLAALSASTDDGKRTQVQGERQGDRFEVRTSTEGAANGERPDSAAGCAMSFAYWNPALRARSQLLNPQTGRFERVSFSPLPSREIDVEGGAVSAQGWRLAGAGAPIDLWYSTEGRWIGLDTTVSGKRLSYRLPATATTRP
ncbi:DUF6134 family protein [Ideonella sp. YS5]|uniref:DUF6134 family protein n=1 Tax=Ideonella sp. YS5 TaxID=3453714 RepID=UPI003EEDADF9